MPGGCNAASFCGSMGGCKVGQISVPGGGCALMAVLNTAAPILQRNTNWTSAVITGPPLPAACAGLARAACAACLAAKDPAGCAGCVLRKAPSNTFSTLYRNAVTPLRAGLAIQHDLVQSSCSACYNTSRIAPEECVDECIDSHAKAACGKCAVWTSSPNRAGDMDECITCAKQAGRPWAAACR